MSADTWAVFRQDFTGNEFLVEKHLTEQRARELVEEFESHRHHQHYWACQLPEAHADYAAMLDASLRSGSSMDSSLKVLRSQRATAIDCIEAVRNVRKISFADSKRIVLNSSAYADQAGLLDALIEKIDSKPPQETGEQRA